MADASAQHSRGPAPPRQGGFTLLEVLVAFAIAAPALILLFGQGATSIGAVRTSAQYEEAVSRARSHLDLLSDGALQAGERRGDEGHGFAWRTDIVPLATIPARHTPRDRLYASGMTLFAVTVEVSWAGPGGARRVTLDSRRLGPAAASPP